MNIKDIMNTSITQLPMYILSFKSNRLFNVVKLEEDGVVKVDDYIQYLKKLENTDEPIMILDLDKGSMQFHIVINVNEEEKNMETQNTMVFVNNIKGMNNISNKITYSDFIELGKDDKNEIR